VKTLARIISPLLFILCLSVADSHGQAWQARHGLTSAQYQSAFNQLLSQGYRLTWVSGYTVNNQERFAAIWEKTAGPAWTARHAMSSADYQTEFNKNAGQGYRLVLVNGYSVNNQDRYVAIWVKSGGPAWQAKHGMTPAEYQTEFNKWVGQGYRLSHISGYAVNNQDRYAAIWEKTGGPAWQAKHGMTSAQYQAEFDKWVGQGYRLTVVSGYSVNNQPRYAAIWEKKSGPGWYARHDLTSPQYQGEFNNFYYQGFALKQVSGFTIGNSDRYAAIWEGGGLSGSDAATVDNQIEAYMKKHNTPGMSIAITKDGRLVFAKGYGLADKGTGERVNPANLFRIASVSKPITSVAIQKLVEQGKLNLDKTVFGPNAILGTQFGTKPYGDRVKKITVRHLLQHLSGWSNDGGDPMFLNPGQDHNQTITWVLDNRAPKNEPGTAYEYLNFGYCVLGRIIEKVGGQNYEGFVKSQILNSAGVTNMQIGGDTLASRKPNEVVYYAPGSPYNLKLTRMDAHGGWIASAIDLVRLMVRVDGFNTKPDILQAASITRMFTGSSVKPGYGMGWIVDPAYKGHNGAMDGTIAFLVRRNDGYCLAVLVNMRPSGDGFCFELKGVLDSIVTSVGKWPAYDLF
jgi:CubicO group peptidase (beta-lactamase class C family)